MMVASRLGAIVAATSAAAAAVGLRLCGVVEAPPAPGRCRLECFAHVGLHQQRDIAGDLAAGAGKDRERGCDLRQPIAMAVPWRLGQRQVEQGGQPLGHVEALVVERRERADRAAELQHQGVAAQPAQPLAGAGERRRVAGELEPERHR